MMIFTLPYWISNVCLFAMAVIHGLTRVIYKTFDKNTLCEVLEKYRVRIKKNTKLSNQN